MIHFHFCFSIVAFVQVESNIALAVISTTCFSNCVLLLPLQIINKP